MHNNLFTDYGIPVSAEEERTAAICTNSEGDYRFVIAAKGFVIIVNLENDDVKQVFFPENNDEYPYSSFSSNGLFYTGAANMFMVLDPFLEQFVYYKVIENGEEIVGFSFAEDIAGNIYFTSFPHCHLLCYTPHSNEMKDFGMMDLSEKYPGTVAMDQTGWAYIGIGTEKKNIVAFHLEKGLKRDLLAEPQREKGTGYVHLGEDGVVYGHLGATSSVQWMKFSNGDFENIDVEKLSPSLYTGTGFQRIHRYQEGNYHIENYSLSEGFIELVHRETAQTKDIHFSYTSDGAKLSTIYLGPDDHIYGTSMHPLQFFQFDGSTNKMTNFGGEIIEKGGGGNIPAYASSGNLLIGAAYAGGKLYVFDTTKEFKKSENPKLVLQEESIHRPRCAIALKEQEHIVWGGFPGYGMIGGSLGIYHIKTEENHLLTHEKLVKNQSTISLGELSSGDILGGTSIETPGGAESQEKEARLYVLDWKSKKVKNSFVPIQGAREIAQIFVDQFDRAHCLTEQSIYFVCDPYTEQILYQKDLSSWGKIVRNGFAYDLPTNTLYCLLSHTLLGIVIQQEQCLEPKPIHSLPMCTSSGIVHKNNKIYYGSGSHFCSIQTRED
ncbi:hypothetical protein SAMN05518871_101104 [Psychrobacillus sp. OK028]|uniref:hypothetical protein n=1 Tax=Psychrobacillus sp. OK028 TaxID=1884359 RepID=UPI00088C6AEC|nr:hypothetical protein [Psychrobacillus sp. OK028]SDM39049.1 hypothetical protein SAMN05518871_101104 [Psychrobacillus sp. OK028]